MVTTVYPCSIISIWIPSTSPNPHSEIPLETHHGIGATHGALAKFLRRERCLVILATMLNRDGVNQWDSNQWQSLTIPMLMACLLQGQTCLANMLKLAWLLQGQLTNLVTSVLKTKVFILSIDSISMVMEACQQTQTLAEAPRSSSVWAPLWSETKCFANL